MYLHGKGWRAHRMSYAAHIGHVEAGCFVRHTCDTPKCVNPSHLILGDAKDNAADRDRRGRSKLQGEDNYQTVLTNAQVLSIFQDQRTDEELSRVYGVGAATVGNIRRGATWTSVTGLTEKKWNIRRKLTDEQAMHVFTSDIPAKDLATEYGVVPETIWAIRNGSTYRRVTKAPRPKWIKKPAERGVKRWRGLL